MVNHHVVSLKLISQLYLYKGNNNEKLILFVQNFYVNVHDGIMHNRQNVETTQMPMNWWTDIQNVVS